MCIWFVSWYGDEGGFNSGIIKILSTVIKSGVDTRARIDVDYDKWVGKCWVLELGSAATSYYKNVDSENFLYN